MRNISTYTQATRLLLFTAILVAATLHITGWAIAGSQGGDCTVKGIPLQGRVQVVSSLADITVRKVSSLADLQVKKVSCCPSACGEWEFVDSLPDFTIEYVEAFEDVSVEFVHAFPGVR